MKKLDPIWEEGEFIVEEVNSSEDGLHAALGIDEERSYEIRILLMKSVIKHKSVHKSMIDVSKICVHPNELAYACYIMGVEVTYLKRIGSDYKDKMEKQIEQMEALLKGEEKKAEEEDVDLTFPEEEEEEEEPLVFDDEK